jgi:hypothetical protein
MQKTGQQMSTWNTLLYYNHEITIDVILQIKVNLADY